ncbi:phage tail fiber protein [Pseudescherichia vulneris]|uniref:phage tail fiber protein n=1 Tax=Pseudescherichia vulneris TaxID=566 RepID=UPI0028B1A541|nr:phage tail protein [Pseudescherichia vulneris]
MIYTTGTIAGSGSTLTGTGTNFTAAGTLIRNGCTVIVLTSPPQAFQITSVTSATQLAVSPAVNPAIPAGTRYAILLSDSLSVDGLALDIAETFGMYQRYMGGFADIVQSSGIVTITINGKPVTVPGLQSVVQKDATGTVPLSLGGTAATDATGARKNLGLGSAATLNAGSGEGNVMQNGASIFFNAVRVSSVYDLNTFTAFLSTYQQTQFFPGTGQGVIMNAVMESNNRYGWRLIGDSGGTPYWQAKINDVLSDTYKICAIGKTVTADANGFIKLSSPVIKLFTDGSCEANEEAEGVTATRASVGVYKVTGSAGLNSDGIWTIEIPQDLNGNRLCFVDVYTTKSGVITLSVFKRRFDIDTAMVVAGEPMDIPDGRWLDLRLDMPANSVYNQKRLAAEQALPETDASASDQ